MERTLNGGSIHDVLHAKTIERFEDPILGLQYGSSSNSSDVREQRYLATKTRSYLAVTQATYDSKKLF